MNLRSRLHIFGYGISSKDAAAAATANVKLPTWSPAYTADTKDKWPTDVEVTDYKGTANEYPINTLTTQGSTDNKKNYHAYVIWQNPDVQGAVTYDGFEAKMYWTIVPPLPADKSTGGGAWASEAEMIKAPPKLSVHFQDNITEGQRFDIMPGSTY